MKNRFRHCSDENEATSLLCLLLSSKDDKREKQALNDEYDAFVSVIATQEIMQFDPLEEMLAEQFLDEVPEEPEQEGYHYQENIHYKDIPEEDEKELGGYLKRFDDLDETPHKLNLVHKPFDDDDWEFLDADNLDGYPPGMTRDDLIHVGEIDPDYE